MLSIFLIVLIFIQLILLYKFIRFLFSPIPKTFEEFLPKDKIGGFHFSETHKKAYLGFISLLLILYSLTALIFAVEILTIKGDLERITKISKRVIVYTTDGRYGIAFKKGL